MSAIRIRKLCAAAGTIAFVVCLAAPGRADHLAQSNTVDLQTRPIELGTSGSSLTLLRIKQLLYCYAGTLGGLATNRAGDYILSNNHVLAKENHNLDYGSQVDNDTIIQPGLLDEGSCSIDSGNSDNAVAVLTDYVPILFGKGKNKPENNVDAAIAVVNSNDVEVNGTILGIGTVDGSLLGGATVGMPVQKTGRTTAHTFGNVEAVNVTVDVSYESGDARFVNQMRIRRPCGDAGFSDAGDSGSLIVTVPAPGAEPQAVGLLFAGSDTDTFANAISDVENELSVSMVASDDDLDNEGAMLSDYQAIADSCSTTGGGGGGGGRHGPPFGASGPAGLSVASDVLSRHSEQLFGLPEVVGHGIGADENGDAVIEIYVADRARRAAHQTYPSQLEGFPVRVIETGPVRAF